MGGSAGDFDPEALMQQGEKVVASSVDHDQPGVDHLEFEFDNGWGASVLRGRNSYGAEQGLWEVAFTDGINGEIRYDSPVTGDVRGWLTPAEVVSTLSEIAALPKRPDQDTTRKVGA